MWEAIRGNQRRSWVLIGLMGVILVTLGFLAGMTIDPQMGGAFGALFALAVWLVLYLTALAGGNSILLASSNAHEIQKEDAPRLWNIVEEMTIASGLGSMPKVYIIDDDAPNAFAVGRKPEKACVAVTSGLLKRLNRDELQGVIAHEIGHIKNLDVKFMTLAGVMMGAIILISDIFVRSVFYGAAARRRSSDREGGGQAQIIIFIVALVFAILAPILAQMLYFACSRKREYLADASSARFTRYPEGLASALEKIAGRVSTGSKKVNRTVAPMYIVNPLSSSAVGLFSTHPPTDKRVQVLRGMAGAGFAAYEQAFRQVHGEGQSCLGERTLGEAENVETRAASKEPEKKQDMVGRIQEVNDLLTMHAGFLFLPCACGLNIKVPGNFKHEAIKCPKCGTQHDVPSKQASGQAQSAASEAETASYKRKSDRWESFQCPCGHTLNLSPAFSGSHISCNKCGRKISIE